MVRDQAALRLAGAGAPHQGAGRLALRAAARLRRRARGGARPSRSSRRATRSRWTRPSAAWSRAATSGSRSPRSTRSRRSARSSRSTASTPAPSPASRSPRSATRPPRRSPPGACAPTWCRRASSPPPACSRTGREYDELLDPINRVFLPRADIATENLVAGLIDLGWECDDVTAYRTVRATPPPAPTRDAIKTGKFDAVVFTSSSTVRNLVGIAGKPHPSTIIAVIGPATAKTAEEHGLRVDVLAPKPDVEVLVDALADFGAARRARDARGRPAGHQAVASASRRRAARSEPSEAERAQRAQARRRRASSARPRTARPSRGPLIRPRRLRTTPALRRMVAETSLRAAPAGAAAVRARGPRRAAADRVDARRRPAHPRHSLLQGGRRGGRARARRRDAVRHPRVQGRDRLRRASTPAGILNLAITDVVAEVGDALTVMSDLCLDEFTDHGHCGVLTPDGRVDNDRDAGGVRRDGARPGRTPASTWSARAG